MLTRLTQSRIGLRLPAMVVVALAVSLAAASAVYYYSIKTAQQTLAHHLAESLAGHTETAYRVWLDGMFRLTEDLAEGSLAPEALRQFNDALALQPDGWQSDLRQAYIDENPFAAGERQNFDQGTSRPAYDRVHDAFNQYLREHLERFGYYDLFLISTDGDILYSVAKEDDFATSVVSGLYADTGLARAWRAAMDAPSAITSYADFEHYLPSGNAPASFLARRIVDLDAPGTPVIGVVAIQLPEEGIVEALNNITPLNPRDDAYIIGPDGLSRSPNRLEGALSVLSPLPDLPQIAMAQAGETGFIEHVPGLHGHEVLAWVETFESHGLARAVVVELDHAATFTALTEFKRTVLVFMVIGIAIFLGVGYLIARAITKPLGALQGSMERIATEDYETAVVGIDRRDELGELSRRLDVFRNKLIEGQIADEQQRQSQIEQELVVKDLGRGLRGLASGYLDTRLTDAYSGGYEQLRADFNETVETMENLMRSIASNAMEIRARAEEISASSDDLSHRTENQAATLEETAAALDELTASVRTAAESASEVESVVADARKEAEKSGQVVSEAVSAMSMIRQSSNEISQIIGVIDDIAFQTNLLALNAGVEAARAGDAGRGFAVVASEVRALAQRSSEAAKQIKTLITGSAEQVETGVGLVGRAGDTLRMIIERVSNIDQLIGGIATGSREQSAGLGEINVGVSQLDQVTQQNAAMVEEVTAAATTLNTESSALMQIVSRFRLNDSEVSMDASAFTAHVARQDAPRPAENEDDDFAAAVQAPRHAQAAPPIAANLARWQDF
ncbi:methyl-accepting chemotaxis protein [Pararhodobacter zhoushanensis]|uniref:Methyl-accepting chemotaxis protein n=1 Tax=Pararhodobacter zhoushanensis TaxID=2479545 RepID=A0ABT3GWW3_9RHOB|nr:methyl-accepting chemotaxis protein [Pararhodobacter zhoushanensis]MCW1932022.1 methyl-accepting chemotaxis protein [Pararhodobacter zhoushanensis]